MQLINARLRKNIDISRSANGKDTTILLLNGELGQRYFQEK